MTTRFDEWIDIIHQSDWYTFPDRIQSMLPTVIMAAQEPVVLQAFGELSCTRESFKKVISSGIESAVAFLSIHVLFFFV